MVQQFGLQPTAGQVAWMVIGAVAVRLWAKFVNAPFSRKKEIAFWILAPLSFYVLLSIAGLVSPREEPRLRGEIGPMLTLEWKDDKGVLLDRMGFVIFASVTNIGSPSIASEWRMRIEAASQTPINIPRPDAISDGLIIAAPNAQTPAHVLYSADDLAVKLAEMPLQKGARSYGVLLFSSTGHYDDIVRPGTKFTIFFKDVLGKEQEASMPYRVAYGALRIPGLKSGPIIPNPNITIGFPQSK